VLPAEDRTVSINGVKSTETAPVAFCNQESFENGDLDFDGLSYRADWPNGSRNFPTPFRYTGPFTNGHRYPKIQFEANVGASEFLCDVATGAGCTVPPQSARFYPFWTLG
jgi:hypothetical protein